MPDRPHIARRPWGVIREYARNEPCTVWIIEMQPGQAGSLQSHALHEELWIMLDDGAEVQVGEKVLRPRAYDEVMIHRGVKHRLSTAHADHPVRMLEVMFGEVRDDDKVRYEDRYGRAGTSD
jgi:mannose-1-phosphate guanylyltransferase/mannose-6-phosphate isomerase